MGLVNVVSLPDNPGFGQRILKEGRIALLKKIAVEQRELLCSSDFLLQTAYDRAGQQKPSSRRSDQRHRR